MDRLLSWFDRKFPGHKCLLLIPLYLVFYLPCFFWLDLTDRGHYYVIHTAIDEKIPFCEYFVIFYYLWFVYVTFAIASNIVITDRKTYFKSLGFVTFGMTLFLLISFLFPNSHDLRPAVYPRENLSTSLIALIQSFDTPTNVFPSIHVYNAIGAHFAIIYNRRLKDIPAARLSSLFVCAGICLSTVFLKQHSILDVIGAFILAAVMYPVFFGAEFCSLLSRIRQKK